MDKTLTILFLFFIISIKCQRSKDTIIKTFDIETVVISPKDYEKLEISYSLKQKTNTRYLSISGSEIGLRFKNNYEKKELVNDITLFLHKTEKEIPLTDLEINFYEVDSLTGKPSKKINKQQILYSPKNRNRGKVKINVLAHKILFNKNGIFVSIKW